MSGLPRFRPFGWTDDEYAELLVLRDGVPDTLEAPLRDWFITRLTLTNSFGMSYVNTPLLHEIFALTRVDLGSRAVNSVDVSSLQRRLPGMTESQMLTLLDVLLYLDQSDEVPRIADSLDHSSSKWQVGLIDGRWRLIERLPAGVQDQVESVIAETGQAGTLLHQAFTAAYGLQPNPGECYKMAVKAVETAAHNQIEPNNAGATLGTILRNLRDASPSWTLPLKERADHVGGNALLIIALAQALWDGQEDRHRDGRVGLAEARTAFHAATTLVAWFSEGSVTR